MVRLADLPDYERAHLLSKNSGPIGSGTPYVSASKPLSAMRLALLTTAGLHFRGDPTFEFADATFRPIPGEENALSAEDAAACARRCGMKAATASSLDDALERIVAQEAPGRVLICGSLYLAGHVLRRNG